MRIRVVMKLVDEGIWRMERENVGSLAGHHLVQILLKKNMVRFYTDVVFSFCRKCYCIRALINLQLVVLVHCTHSIEGEPGHFKPRLPHEMGIDIGWIIISDIMEHLWNNCQVHMQSSTIEEDNHGWNVRKQAANNHENLMTRWLDNMLYQG